MTFEHDFHVEIHVGRRQLRWLPILAGALAGLWSIAWWAGGAAALLALAVWALTGAVIAGVDQGVTRWRAMRAESGRHVHEELPRAAPYLAPAVEKGAVRAEADLHRSIAAHLRRHALGSR